MNAEEHQRIHQIVGQILHEAHVASAKYGDENPDGIMSELWPLLDEVRVLVDTATDQGRATWTQILTEEFMEVVTEPDPMKLRAELFQLAACCARWISALERRERANR